MMHRMHRHAAPMSRFSPATVDAVMRALNPAQQRYEAAIRDPDNGIIVGVGPAGTGKTFVPCAVAAELFLTKKIRKILITRPAVNADESHGFLPGDIESKMMPYMRPIYDCLVQSGVTTAEIRAHLKNEVIEICPLSYTRGRTFSDCFVIADETQNTTPNQMKMLLTRIGSNCKMVLTGDPSQSDISPCQHKKNGLVDLLDRIVERDAAGGRASCIEVVEFGDADVVRSRVVQEVLQLY
jgi:phosphate starvation-inducible PhoH-like protein